MESYEASTYQGVTVSVSDMQGGARHATKMCMGHLTMRVNWILIYFTLDTDTGAHRRDMAQGFVNIKALFPE